MYNETKKQAFLDFESKEKEKTQARLKEYIVEFTRSMYYEDMWEKDLSDFSRQETIILLNNFLSSNVQTGKKRINIIRDYQEWASNQDIINWSKFPISKEDLNFTTAIHKTIYPSINSFMQELKAGVPFDEGRYVVPLFCFAWIGIPYNKCSGILDQDVDLRNGLVNFQNNAIRIEDPEILQIMRQYRNTSISYRTQNRTFEVYPQLSPYFLRPMVTKNSKKKPHKISSSSIPSCLLQAKQQAEMNLQRPVKLEYLNVYRSGQLLRVRKLELSGFDVLSSKNKKIVHSYFDNRGDYYDQIFLYKKYKEAFDLT